jgi:hypothetical protein
MESGDFIKQKRDRILFNANNAVKASNPTNKTTQSDSQTLIDLNRGGQRVFVGNQIVFQACCGTTVVPSQR